MADRPAQDRKLPLPVNMIGTKWTTVYDPGVALDIISRISMGETLRTICAPDSGFPHPQTFMKWCARVPKLGEAYLMARKLSGVFMEEEALDAARSIAQSPGTAQKVSAFNTLLGQLRWSAARRDPKQFADNRDTAIVVPIQINTTMDMGKGMEKVEDSTIYSVTVDAKEELAPEEGEFTEITDVPEDSPFRSGFEHPGLLNRGSKAYKYGKRTAKSPEEIAARNERNRKNRESNIETARRKKNAGN